MTWQNQRCPYCGAPGISRVKVLFSYITRDAVRCPGCSGFSAHPGWAKRLFILYIPFGLLEAYGLSYNHLLHYYSPKHFLFWVLCILVLGIIIFSTISVHKINDSQPLQGWRRYVLWIVWLGFVFTLFFTVVVSLMKGENILADAPGVPEIFWSTVGFFVITIWITWENFRKECARLFSGEKQ